MPKVLYLLRHSQSAEKQPGQTDKDRELTPVGVKETFQLGGLLQREKIFPEVMYCSVAERAKMTAQLLADTIKLDNERIIEEEELFTASVRTFLAFIQELDNSYNHVLCVGHNPTISYLAEFLTKAEIGDMPPTALAILQVKGDSWLNFSEGTAELIRFVNPQLFSSD